VTALIGPSGCGKSTLLRSVNRLNDLLPEVRVAGDMLLAGSSVYDSAVDVIELRKRMGMVFQKPNPSPCRSPRTSSTRSGSTVSAIEGCSGPSASEPSRARPSGRR